MKKIFYPVIVALFLTGCSLYQVDSQPAPTDKYYPPKKNIRDVVYLESVSRPYEVIGQVIVTTERRQTLESVLPKMQYEAAQLGGDAYTDIRTDATGNWKKIKPQALLGNAYIRANYSARVIVYTDKTDAEASAVPAEEAAPAEAVVETPEPAEAPEDVTTTVENIEAP
jgi:hypothetical protein